MTDSPGADVPTVTADMPPAVHSDTLEVSFGAWIACRGQGWHDFPAAPRTYPTPDPSSTWYIHCHVPFHRGIPVPPWLLAASNILTAGPIPPIADNNMN